MGPVDDIKSKQTMYINGRHSQKRGKRESLIDLHNSWLFIFIHLGLFLDAKFGKGRSEKPPTQKP